MKQKPNITKEDIGGYYITQADIDRYYKDEERAIWQCTDFTPPAAEPIVTMRGLGRGIKGETITRPLSHCKEFRRLVVEGGDTKLKKPRKIRADTRTTWGKVLPELTPVVAKDIAKEVPAKIHLGKIDFQVGVDGASYRLSYRGTAGLGHERYSVRTTGG